MTSEPKAPGAQAIYLYRQLDRDDPQGHEQYYARIKIFTDEGRKHADEIPFLKGHGDIKNVRARTIQADGRIVNFNGTIYEKMIVKAKGLKYLAKTFTLADVQAGSIIEYRYTRNFEQGYVFDSQWLLSEELFTKHAKFSLHRSSSYAIGWSFPRGLPEGTNPPQDDHSIVRLETQNIPAFQIEDYMPPATEMKYRVDFRYQRSFEKDADKFWQQEAQRRYRDIDFFDRRRAMERAVEQILSPSDSAEQKLQLIYSRCQKLRNTSFEREKTSQEQNRENLKDTQSVEDVWKHGYGDGGQITWLFLALARAAGFDASPVYISTRNTHFFNPKLMNPADLNTNVVLVKLNGKDLYLDPGIAFAPFGLLPWYETGVPGLCISKDGGTWITPPSPIPLCQRSNAKQPFSWMTKAPWKAQPPSHSRDSRLCGGASTSMNRTMLNASSFLKMRSKDSFRSPAKRNSRTLPTGIAPRSPSLPSLSWKVPGWASAAGRRTILAAGLFGGGEKRVFEGSNRVHPIYFDFPYSDVDDVTMVLPTGLQVSNLPQPQHIDIKVCSYDLTAEKKDGALHVNRRLIVDLQIVDAKYYGGLRTFFQAIRNGDNQQVILSAAASPN